jgi:hypothetical protein
MKWFFCAALASNLFLSACAHDELAGDTSTQSAAPVPGEKTGEGSMEPGLSPGGASANVRW